MGLDFTAMLTVKRIKTVTIDTEEVLRRELTLTRLIVVAAQRRWHKKKSALDDLTPAKTNPPKDLLDSDRDHDYE